MNPVTVGLQNEQEPLAIALAQEIAMGVYSVEDILKRHQLSGEDYAKLSQTQYFRNLLLSATIEWESAKNTQERTKVKAGTLIEQWLLEANAQLHNRDAPLSARVELAKLLKTIAGMGERMPGEGAGERFSVTINLGGDAKLKFEKQVTPQVIDGEVTHQEIV